MKRTIKNALTRFRGRNHDKNIENMIGPEGAFTILIEHIDAIDADLTPFYRLEKLVILVGIFQDFGLEMLKKAQKFFALQSVKEDDAHAKKAQCISALITLFAVCGKDCYKAKEHLTFIKYNGKDVLYMPSFYHFAKPIPGIENCMKKATDMLMYSYKNFEEDVIHFLSQKVLAIKKDYAVLQSLYTK